MTYPTYLGAFSPYLRHQKTCLRFGDLKNATTTYDRFISAFTLAERVNTLAREIKAKDKHLLAFDEYRFLSSELTPNCIKMPPGREAFVIEYYLKMYPLESGTRIAVDITGFLRPHLLFLLMRLHEFGLANVDLFYAEPIVYNAGSRTVFSFGRIDEVRQVDGYAGSHSSTLEAEMLIVGCGYDTRLIRAVAHDKQRARKVRMYPFPALQPHMYQESRIQVHSCKEDFVPFEHQVFAPAYDPFATAMALERFINGFSGGISDLFFCPLATKAQVIGFGLYYLDHRAEFPASSVLFPVASEYSKDTGKGLAEVWRYRFRHKPD
jgi:hypothetical protein